MNNIDFWQTLVSAVVSFVFYVIGLFTNKK